METHLLLHKLYLDFTHFYLNSKWAFFLFTVYWRKDHLVEVSDIQEFRTVHFGLFGSFHKTHMRVQVIIDPRNIAFLASWLYKLLETSESIVSHINAWPGNVDFGLLPVDNKYLQTLKGCGENMLYNTACAPFFLINEWLSLLLENLDCTFLFCDSFDSYYYRVLNIHLKYSPLFYLRQRNNFIHLSYKGEQSQQYYFNCSFEEWWNYRCFPDTLVYHPTVYILNKIAECGLYHAEFELNDDTAFLEKLIRFGFENIPIECSYTYQLPSLYFSNRINLIVGYKILKIKDIELIASHVLNYLQDLSPMLVYRYASKEIDCLSYPNKVSRSIWTEDYKTCKLLCRRYDSEWDALRLDDALSSIEPKMESISLTTGLLERSIHTAVQKDIDYMRVNKRDFISVYLHHDPFTKKQQ